MILISCINFVIFNKKGFNMKSKMVINKEVEVGDFLTKEQKFLKGAIMTDWLEAFEKRILPNQKLFSLQQFADLVTSLLVMFNREMICSTLSVLGDAHNKKKFTQHLFTIIDQEIDRVLSEQPKQ